ncbi:hypothetical protein [Haloarchaeobius sp. HRN-SO-5]|uniref:hypothetical protein n=1 Tax=Haloarchaeobius sp. HRN-SO-5 TaxID=3446118 RepID=UPI003EC14B83
MASPSRRAVLGSLGIAAGSLAGCLGLDDAGTDGTGTDGTETDTTGTDDTASVDLRLETDLITQQDPIRVLPDGLRSLLVEAARSDGPVRGHYDILVESPPSPVLPVFDDVRLQGTGSDADGTYVVDVDAGARYEMRFTATRADSVPEDASVVDATTLSGERRRFVQAAIDGEQPSVYPESELGTWARTEFDGGYVRVDGETYRTYRGQEVQQTDAAFFSDVVWYVLSLTPTEDATSPVVLDCSDVDDDAQGDVSDLLSSGGDYPKTATDPSEALRSFAEENRLVVSHCEMVSVHLD